MQLKRSLVPAVTYRNVITKLLLNYYLLSITKLILTGIIYQDIPGFQKFHIISRMCVLIVNNN